MTRPNFKEIAASILLLAQKAGADKAEVYIQTSKNTKFTVSDLQVETSERSLSQGYGLTFIKQNKKVFIDSTDFSLPSIKDTIDRATQLVTYADEDPCNTLPMPSSQYRTYNLYDETLTTIPVQRKIALAQEIEKLAVHSDDRIKKASYIWYEETIEDIIVANTQGVFGSNRSSKIDLEAAILAVSGEERQEGEYGLRVHFYKDLPPADKIAREACDMALALIGGSPVKTTTVPVVFDPHASRSILKYGIFKAASGDKIHRNSSYLEGRLDHKIASELVTIIDDGTLTGGPRTAPFDDEGVATQKNIIVDKGVLKMYLYNTATACKAQKHSTGNARRRSYRELPKIEPRNLYLVKGTKNPAEIIAEVQNGFWVKNTIGFGVDSVTGGYSIGAAGRWITNGKLSEPVSGVTLASTLDDIMLNVDAVGNDLEFHSGTACPTFRVAHMIVSGK